MNAKVIGALLAGLVIGAIIGYFSASKSGLEHGQGKGGGLGLNPPMQAYITLQNDGSCRQTVGPDQMNFPEISKAEATTVEWMGSAATTAPQVSFPTAGVPFTQNAFSGEADSGAVTPGTQINIDYPFSSVKVFNPSTKQWADCDLKIQPMGVHVDH